jgi:4-amino-4-deoxy-L-arabinose transferase-like glycosyltransferase
MRWLFWLLFGISAGLCIMSKVHGVFLWVGFILFILVQKRVFLKQPQLYVSLLLTAVIASPILFWNINHHFITYQYHSERVTVSRFAINPTSFFRELFGQVLYNNPLIVVLSFSAVKAWFKKKERRNEALSVYLWIALPLILLLLFIALFRDTLPHWSGPAYVALLPLTAVYIDNRWQRQPVPKCIYWSLGITLFAVVLGLVLIKSYPGTMGRQSAEDLGKGDFTLDMHGWRKAGAAFRQLYANDVQRGIVKTGTPVVCYKWFPAAHEEYYFCRQASIPMVGLGLPFDLHQYAWRNQDLKFDQAYCIVPSDEYYDVREKYGAYFTTIDSVTEINSYRSNKLACRFYVYRLQGYGKR